MCAFMGVYEGNISLKINNLTKHVNTWMIYTKDGAYNSRRGPLIYETEMGLIPTWRPNNFGLRAVSPRIMLLLIPVHLNYI